MTAGHLVENIESLLKKKQWKGNKYDKSIPKERVDVLLVERGLVETREQAKRSIMAGIVFSAETRLDKPGEKIPDRCTTYCERFYIEICKPRWLKA